mgnify:CR=1 FL=1
MGVQLLSTVEFKFVRSTSSQDDYQASPPLISGNRYYCLYLTHYPTVITLLQEKNYMELNFATDPSILSASGHVAP